MKLKSLFALAFTMWLMSCTVNSRDEKTPVAERVDVPVNIVMQDNNDSCLDAKMIKWLDAFNAYQEEGFDMHEAHNKASIEADQEFEKCKNGLLAHATDNVEN